MTAAVATRTSTFEVTCHTLSGWDDVNDKANRSPQLWARGEKVQLDPTAKRTAELVAMKAIQFVSEGDPGQVVATDPEQDPDEDETEDETEDESEQPGPTDTRSAAAIRQAQRRAARKASRTD
jgi:hypothetical protein